MDAEQKKEIGESPQTKFSEEHKKEDLTDTVLPETKIAKS